MRKERIDNPRYPHRVTITRLSVGRASDDDPFGDESLPVGDSVSVLYDGVGRSYTDTTTEGDENVDENKRKASIPVHYDGWREGCYPLDGDMIEVRIGAHVETGIITDCEGDNNRTVVYWKLRRV